MSSIDTAFKKIAALVETFHINESRYMSPHYSEAEARKDFIDKFWMALGWDVNHDRQIDQLVYDLYGLTDDEIDTVEEATTKISSN